MSVSSKARREILLILLIICAGFLFYNFLFGETGYFQVRVYRAKLQQMKVRNQNLKLQKQKLEGDLRKLKEDPEAVERIAREELNLARPGDVIIQMPPEKTEPETSPSRQP